MNIRLALAVISSAFLCGGYALSQKAALTGEAPQHSAKFDQPPVALVSLVMLIGLILLFVFEDKLRGSQ